MNPDFKRIQYFLKAAETLNFCKAAKELFVSPQALNKQILKLEVELGASLFERTTRNVRLTEFGKELQLYFQPVIKQYEIACLKMEAYETMKKRTIRIGFFQAISKKDVINPIMKYLLSMDHNLHIEPIAGEIDEVNDWIRTGKIDLSITNIHEYEDWSDMAIVPFLTTPAQVVVSLSHPWAAKSHITLKDLNNMPFLLLTRTKQLEKNSFYTIVQGRERYFAPNFNSMLAALETEDYYAVMPKLFESMNWSGLKYIDLPKEYRFSYQMVAMYSPDSRLKHHFDQLYTYADKRILQLH